MTPAGRDGRMAGRPMSWADAGQAVPRTGSTAIVRIMVTGSAGGLVLAEVELLRLAVQRVREELLVTCWAQVILELLERWGRLLVGVVAVAKELTNRLELIVGKVRVGEQGRVVGRVHLHAHHIPAIRTVRQVLTAQVTREMQHAAPLPYVGPRAGSARPAGVTGVPIHSSPVCPLLSSCFLCKIGRTGKVGAPVRTGRPIGPVRPTGPIPPADRAPAACAAGTGAG